jgi:hypothetical protein
MFWKRIIVENQERVLVAKNGRFRSILAPGDYRMFVAPGVTLCTERHQLANPVFESKWADYVARKRPDVIDRHFVRIETNECQIAMVYVDTQLFTVMTPAKRMLFWREPFDITAELIDVIGLDEHRPFDKSQQTRHGAGSARNLTWRALMISAPFEIPLDQLSPAFALKICATTNVLAGLSLTESATVICCRPVDLAKVRDMLLCNGQRKTG